MANKCSRCDSIATVPICYFDGFVDEYLIFYLCRKDLKLFNARYGAKKEFQDQILMIGKTMKNKRAREIGNKQIRLRKYFDTNFHWADPRKNGRPEEF